jgi:hypothetical protein
MRMGRLLRVMVVAKCKEEISREGDKKRRR